MQALLEELEVEKGKLARHNAGLQAELGADEEELRKLRAAEESALPALADEELAARFGGDVTLTARGAPVTLTPDQARPRRLLCPAQPAGPRRRHLVRRSAGTVLQVLAALRACQAL